MGEFSKQNEVQHYKEKLHPKPVKKIKTKLKEITGRSNARSMEQRITRLKQVITGGVNYFGIADMRTLLNICIFC
jgi:hypothetical protein